MSANGITHPLKGENGHGQDQFAGKYQKMELHTS